MPPRVLVDETASRSLSAYGEARSTVEGNGDQFRGTSKNARVLAREHGIDSPVITERKWPL